MDWMCDNYKDCDDGSDEIDCQNNDTLIVKDAPWKFLGFFFQTNVMKINFIDLENYEENVLFWE